MTSASAPAHRPQETQTRSSFWPAKIDRSIHFGFALAVLGASILIAGAFHWVAAAAGLAGVSAGWYGLRQQRSYQRDHADEFFLESFQSGKAIVQTAKGMMAVASGLAVSALAVIR